MHAVFQVTFCTLCSLTANGRWIPLRSILLISSGSSGSIWKTCWYQFLWSYSKHLRMYHWFYFTYGTTMIVRRSIGFHHSFEFRPQYTCFAPGMLLWEFQALRLDEPANGHYITYRYAADYSLHRGRLL